jgi:uncharacterized membrane protein
MHTLQRLGSCVAVLALAAGLVAVPTTSNWGRVGAVAGGWWGMPFSAALSALSVVRPQAP